MTIENYIVGLTYREHVACGSPALQFCPPKDLLNDQFKNFEIISRKNKTLADDIAINRASRNHEVLGKVLKKLKYKWFKESLKATDFNHAIKIERVNWRKK